MTGRRFRLSAAVALTLCACGSDKVIGGSGTISGSVAGAAFSKITAAYWIGKPSVGSLPVIVFLLEPPLDCPGISYVNWDKTIGTSQVLEIGLAEAAARSFHVPTDAYEAYLRDPLNPDADSGTIAVTEINPARNIVGSFEAVYRTDRLQGSFDAVFCPTGVEP